MKQDKHSRTLDEAIKYMAMGARIMGWDFMIPTSEMIGYIVIGNPKHLSMIERKLQDKHERFEDQGVS